MPTWFKRLIWAQRLGELGLEELRQKQAQCGAFGALPDAILVDSVAPGGYGGTGTVLAWERLADYQSQLGDILLILAGGLIGWLASRGRGRGFVLAASAAIVALGALAAAAGVVAAVAVGIAFHSSGSR